MKLNTIDEKIHRERIRANELAEKCEAIPKQIAEIEQEILQQEDEQSIQLSFDRIEALRREMRETRLLQRRAEIRRLKFACEKLKHSIEAKRAEWEQEISKLPEAIETAQLARQAVDMQEQMIKRLEVALAGEERSLVSHENELGTILTEKFLQD